MATHRHLGLVALLSTVPVIGQAQHAEHGAAADAKLGTISFPTSGSPAAQAEFLRGVLYLHSFEYESAERAFRRAQEVEPGFALAYWGEAMTYTHPVWNQQDLARARAALARLAPTAEARKAKAPTEREKAWLGAVEVLYGAGSKPARDTLYARTMERLVRAYPDDLEAKAFYALALLALNQGVRDTLLYSRAAPFADSVFRVNPDHPGAAHYLIHAYDDPLHAALGLPAARAYSRIAPGAPHAQHMTTHIFLALGMWEDVVAQNRIALPKASPLPGHYSSWLSYGLLQLGQYDTARSLLEELRTNAGAGTRETASALAGMRAHWLLHAAGDTPPEWILTAEQLLPPARLVQSFTQGVLAYRRQDSASLTRQLVEVDRLSAQLEARFAAGDPVALAGRVMAKQLAGLARISRGEREAGLVELREAAALEDAIPMEYGPPLIVQPSHELLGDVLLESFPKQALSHYQRALVLAPGRSLALVGTVRAALASGDRATARRALALLDKNWSAADPASRALAANLKAEVSRP